MTLTDLAKLLLQWGSDIDSNDMIEHEPDYTKEVFNPNMGDRLGPGMAAAIGEYINMLFDLFGMIVRVEYSATNEIYVVGPELRDQLNIFNEDQL